MKIVLLTALGVGGATVFGSILGFIFKQVSQKFSDAVLSFAAGVMLSSSVMSLILPSLESGGKFAVPIAVSGIFSGAFCIRLIGKAVPYLYGLVGVDKEHYSTDASLGKVLLFVTAIAVHNLPEGIAAGVGFGSGNTTDALIIAGAIALQNIPEGMVIISPMLASGISPKKTFLCGMFTGLIEVIGTFIGYFAVNISSALLPFALSFAGGAMLYVICDEMIPETHKSSSTFLPSFSLLCGFCLMLLF